ncbi:flavin monoamine oxidase family protein [Leucobacter rhizosphaerae]|uniref:flavin monoamine oxidase family protein n=1 Tax=Leucobacter rhizosphaerae TaxID=2932245 RepID=UPI0024B5418B|nr:NAD(P)/FAD-dependent oxidoreductase [Leucobacter rhizosphaerae]
MSTVTTPPRVAVIGAGLAGLAAAARLVEGGAEVVVYEARDRVGGRVWSETLQVSGVPHPIERGAEFVLAGYDVLRGLCAEHGLELVDTGMSYYVRTPADRPSVTTADMAELGGVAARAAAEGTGARSVADVLDVIGVAGPAREALEARIEMSTAARVDQVTAEHTLEHVASFEPRPSWRIGGGNQGLPDAMAAALGSRVRLGAAVEAVVQDDAVVRVVSGGSEDTYDAAVIALPFGVLTAGDAVRLELPEWKRAAFAGVVQGNAAKLHLALDEVPEPSAVMSVGDRFWTWTANELGGGVGPVLHCFGGELGKLRALGIESGSAEWEARVRALRSDLALAASPAVMTAWPLDPLARGAYTAHAPGFDADDAQALEAPVGRLHFAGEYVDPEFTGLMEGALRSGVRAASAILAG